MSAIRPITCSLDALNIADLVRNELPYTQALYDSSERLHEDVAELFDFYIQHRQALPMYALREATADQLQHELSTYYAMLESALRRLFELSDEDIRDWFDCAAVRQGGFGHFLNYARHRFAERSRLAPNQRHDTVYGRLDAAVDPDSGTLKGVYEFNGDTPVMLFESVNLQNLISEALGEPEAQANDWWEATQQQLAPYAGKAVAVVCDVNFIEDTVTAETLAQAFEAAGAQVYFTTLDGLNHDVFHLEQPFHVDGVDEPMDAVFMLLPWEEMWSSGQDILLHWESWQARVQFFEPPWRWFLSHKAMLAWVTHLFETDPAFKISWSSVAHLPTYRDAQPFIAQGQDYVIKPVTGRLSQNIQIVRNGNATAPTEGNYGDEPMIYQAYVAPGQVTGRENFIVGGWLSGEQVQTLCFREFDGPVLDLKNERFIAHLLTD